MSEEKVFPLSICQSFEDEEEMIDLDEDLNFEEGNEGMGEELSDENEEWGKEE